MKHEKNKRDAEDIHVHLKPVLGMKPGVYLTVLYSFILILILFFILVMPGIKNNGTRFYITTTPEASVIFVDNVYKGTSPTAIFVPKGFHTITVKKDFFKTAVFRENVKGRIFFSLIFPRTKKVTQHMPLIDPEGFLKKRYKEISGYALINDYYEGYQYPSLITRTVREFNEGAAPGKLQELYEFLYTMRYNLGSKDLYNDYIKAINYLQPKSTSGVSDLENVRSFYRKHGFSDKGLLLAYATSFPKKADGYAKELDSLFNGVIDREQKGATADHKLSGSAPLIFGDFKFLKVPGGTYTAGSTSVDKNSFLSGGAGDNFPHRESVQAFYMLESEVTRGQYALFLEKNPRWQKDALKDRVKDNTVTDDYLKDYTSVPGDEPVSEVSWYAASAFASWLTTQLPARLSTFEVRLPTEAEWEWAARLNSRTNPATVFLQNSVDGPLPSNFQRQGALGLADMLGNLWEWCDNYYLPADTLFGRYGMENTAYQGAEKAVRGGSWANEARSVSAVSRGSQEPSWCTPFLGFRVVLVKKAQ